LLCEIRNLLGWQAWLPKRFESHGVPLTLLSVATGMGDDFLLSLFSQRHEGLMPRLGRCPYLLLLSLGQFGQWGDYLFLKRASSLLSVDATSS
jgi:hypothetical protein